MANLETRRLLLRRPRDSDAEALYEIQGDHEAMAHTWSAPSLTAVRERMLAYRAQAQRDGFGPWVACLKESGRLVAWGGLHNDPLDPGWGPEVGYFVHPSYRGRGIASEITQAALTLAFDTLGLEEVGAFAKKQNPASQRVLEKAGFRLVTYVPELDRNQYRVSPESWLRSPEEPPVLDFRSPAAAMSLAEGLAEYYASRSDLIRGRGISAEAREFFRCHDAAHVVFGCGTSLIEEALVKTWSFFGTTAGLGLARQYRLPESKEVYERLEWGPIAHTALRSLTLVPRVMARCRRMRERWPWYDFDAHRGLALSELRSRYGIAVIELGAPRS